MGVTKTQFGKTVFGKDVSLYTVKNSNGMSISATDIGACLVSVVIPDKKGTPVDVVLGFDSAEGYMINGSFFGATVGRCANRTANAAFKIDDKTYNLCVNDNENNLHSDFNKGFHKVLWKADTTENSVIFSYLSKDMENGFPGNFDVKVTYTLTDDNEVKIEYDGVSDKKTLINLTNHSYFNLCGHDSGSIEGTKLQLFASNYTPVVAGAIPTGEIASVKGTVMDFTEPKEIGERINADVEQLKLVKGYDHNYVVDGYDKSMRKIAIATAGDFAMEVYSDLPGVQFYAGNCIAYQEGKDGALYSPRHGFCLETQYFPNSANQEGFEKPVFEAGERYYTTTIYKFKTV